MAILPGAALALLDCFAPVFTQPTFRRILVLLAGAILTPGRRTVANLLRTAGAFADGHVSSYRRVFSRARWSMLRLGCALARQVVTLLPDEAPIVLVGDDTVIAHPGPHVYGKARHRDPVRSSHAFTTWRYGHKWVVLAVLVRFPFARRPWALPVLVALYHAQEDDRSERHPHRTPAQHMIRLLRLMLRWFPARRFVFVGDSAYGTHEVARFCHRHQKRLTLGPAQKQALQIALDGVVSVCDVGGHEQRPNHRTHPAEVSNAPPRDGRAPAAAVGGGRSP